MPRPVPLQARQPAACTALHTRARTAACRSVSSTAACRSLGHAHTRTDWTIGHALRLDHRWSAGRRKTRMRRGCQRAYMRAQGRYLAICQKMPSQMQNCWRQVFFIFCKKLKMPNQFSKLLEMLLITKLHWHEASHLASYEMPMRKELASLREVPQQHLQSPPTRIPCWGGIHLRIKIRGDAMFFS